jgi:hypothetical protein
MISLTELQINDLLVGKEVAYEKPRKDYEDLCTYQNGIDCPLCIIDLRKVGEVGYARIKFQVGKDYSVSLKGKRGALWYCPNCKNFSQRDVARKDFCKFCQFFCELKMKPLRFLCTEIKEEKDYWLIKGVRK